MLIAYSHGFRNARCLRAGNFVARHAIFAEDAAVTRYVQYQGSRPLMLLCRERAALPRKPASRRPPYAESRQPLPLMRALRCVRYIDDDDDAGVFITFIEYRRPAWEYGGLMPRCAALMPPCRGAADAG